MEDHREDDMHSNNDAGRLVGIEAHGAYYGESLPATSTVNDLFSSAGLDFRVEKRAIMVDGHSAPRHRALVRTDNGRILGVVSPQYTVIQNWPAFRPIADAGLTPVAAGYNNHGERTFMQMRVGDNFNPTGRDGDENAFHLLATTGHGGGGALKFAPVTTRMFCRNQIAMMTSKENTMASIWHTEEWEQSLKRVETTIAASLGIAALYKGHAKAMARSFISETTQGQLALAAVEEIDPLPTPIAEDADILERETFARKLERAQKRRQRLLGAIANQGDVEADAMGQCSLWSYINAATRAWDDTRRAGSVVNRFERMNGDPAKQIMWRRAVAAIAV